MEKRSIVLVVAGGDVGKAQGVPKSIRKMLSKGLKLSMDPIS